MLEERQTPYDLQYSNEQNAGSTHSSRTGDLRRDILHSFANIIKLRLGNTKLVVYDQLYRYKVLLAVE